MKKIVIPKKGIAVVLAGMAIAAGITIGQMYYADSSAASVSLNSTGGINADGTYWGATFDADMDSDGTPECHIDTSDIYWLQYEVQELNKSIKAYNP